MGFTGILSKNTLNKRRAPLPKPVKLSQKQYLNSFELKKHVKYFRCLPVIIKAVLLQ